jgi:hypothetical protein
MATFAVPSHYFEARAWLADQLDEAARFREEKAVEYPDDLRNRRAAGALHQAAYYVRGASESPRIRRLAALVDDCLASGIDLLSPGFPGGESERIAVRYRFDRFGDAAGDTDHEGLIEDLYEAMLRDLREQDITQGSPLARRLDAVGLSTQPLAEPVPEELVWRRVAQAGELSRMLASLADAARQEADAGGRLPNFNQPARVPMLRRQLSIALKGFRALGGPQIVSAEKLVAEPPQFADGIVSGVISALEELAFAMDQ